MPKKSKKLGQAPNNILPHRTAKTRYKKSKGANRLPSAFWYPFIIRIFPSKLLIEATIQINIIRDVMSGQPLEIKCYSDFIEAESIFSA